jgi:hypothetical protein
VLQNEKGLKTLVINYRSKHEIDQKEAKILNDEIVLKNQESNRLEPDGRTSFDVDISCSSTTLGQTSSNDVCISIS